MADAPKRYRLVTVADFMQVPPDRLADCLEEFAGERHLGVEVTAGDQRVSVSLDEFVRE